MNDKNLADTLRNLTNSVVAYIQTIELKIQLANMDAKDYWAELKGRLHQVNEKAKEIAFDLEQTEDEVRLQAHLGLIEFKDKWTELHLQAREFSRFLKFANRQVKTQLDWARMKARLGKMELESKWQKEKEEMKHAYQESKNKVDKISHDSVESVKGKVEELKEIF